MNDNEHKSIEEARQKYLQDLDYSQNAPDYNPEPTYTKPESSYTRPEPRPEPTPTPAQPAQAVQKLRGTFWPALLGAIIGGLLVAMLFIGYNYFFNRSGNTAFNESSGPVVNYTGGEADSSVEAVAQVVPESVVGIYAKINATTDSIFGQQSQQYGSVGSGFFVTDNGYIVTNQHVVSESPSSIQISMQDGTEKDAELVWSDANLDIAILKIDVSGVQALNLGDSNDLRVGQTVVAVGNPLGLNYSRSVTAGIISAIDRTLVVNNQLIAEGLIQTDAAINQGNSGGPLVNLSGEVIGINTYKQTQGEGMGFAIPINLFKPIIKQVVETGTFVPTQIGITGYDPEQAQYLGQGRIENFHSGIYINSVTPDSPAAKAGLQQGDILQTIDGQEVNTMIQLRTLIYNHAKGDKVAITYSRNGQEQKAELTL